MARTRRIFTTTALMVSLIGLEWSGPVAARAAEPSSTAPPAAATATTAQVDATAPRLVIDYESLTARLNARPVASMIQQDTFAQRRFFGRGRRNEAARTALVLGTLATIAGAAVLVYANRPECETNGSAGGCGYGTKVVGGSVLASGVFGIAVGAITWR